MAKPIRATPELRGKEAERFIRNMVETERSRITREEIGLAQAIEYFPL